MRVSEKKMKDSFVLCLQLFPPRREHHVIRVLGSLPAGACTHGINVRLHDAQLIRQLPALRMEAYTRDDNNIQWST